MASPVGDPISELKSRRERARAGGGRKALEAIRATGRGTARDRIDLLLDPDSFVEVIRSLPIERKTTICSFTKRLVMVSLQAMDHRRTSSLLFCSRFQRARRFNG